MNPPMTPHQKPQEDVVVTQEDREAAASLVVPHGRWPGFPADFLSGRADQNELTQHLARHRLLGHEAGRRDMREEAGWQPIETAPKDGKDGVVGVWVMDDRGPQHAFWSAWTVVFEGIGLGVDGTWGDTPTHWRYAPEPPALPTEPLGGES